MKKKVLRIILFFLLFILVSCINNTVHANTIDKIYMDIYIDKNGNAEVTEKWVCSTNEGTEAYHPYYNLGESQITNLRVSDEKRTYTTLTIWNTSGTLSSKAYKCGINKIKNGVELCWGISEYGTNEYTVKYNILNFVAQLKDCQMIYWTLIPYEFSDEIGNAQITIHSDTYFEDTIDVWGYGNYGGLCYVNNGNIYMASDGNLKKSEYMTILVKLPDGTFSTRNNLNKDFNYYLEMAEKDAKKYKNSWIYTLLGILAGLSPVVLIFGVSYFVSKKSTYKPYGFNFGEPGPKIPKDVAYYRDIPCNGDIFRAYYIAFHYGLLKTKTDILGAIILKWLKEGVIRTENREGGKIFKKENTVIILGGDENKKFENNRETNLFHMMYVASKDGILENKEFEKWCKKSYSKVLGWFDKILESEREKLEQEGLIIYSSSKINRFLTGKHTATQMLKDEAMKIAGLKKFLLDYTLIADREAIEVELFEDYLIYAQMMGIARQVSKQFKEIYPDMIEQTNFNSYDNLLYINMSTSRGMLTANSARAAAQSYSSGGGGFSSGGGGGGSFGGGGGRRRIPLKFEMQKGTCLNGRIFLPFKHVPICMLIVFSFLVLKLMMQYIQRRLLLQFHQRLLLCHL